MVERWNVNPVVRVQFPPDNPEEKQMHTYAILITMCWISAAAAGMFIGFSIQPVCAAQCELPRHMREVMAATRFVDSTGNRCFVDFYPNDDELHEVPAERVQIVCD